VTSDRDLPEHDAPERGVPDAAALGDPLRVAELWRIVADDPAAMLAVHDAGGTYRYVSAGVEAVLGRPATEVVGRSAYAFFHPDEVDRLREEHRLIVERPEAVRLRYRVDRGDGSYHEVETLAWTLRDDASGELLGIVAVTRLAVRGGRAQDA
jgi:two-component system NtrC family sensor kinase